MRFLSQEDWEIIEDIARFLNQFITKTDRPRYCYIDRLATPYNQQIVEVTLQEALREAWSAEFWVPSMTNVKKFIELCNKDLQYSTIMAALALAYPKREE